ncbi:tRNA uridine-5-carboxymethylaminomethyl(34) synt hesis GTPase MnmE [Desulfonema ishimotonii]|uniref:tRNA modification GTPase MnmE n=1 Tax=Desulfonema ishimotonii TaxID=45657 RepID=A0A401G3P6_9BACT|nr:tRNA uridine-5-carboxymethylaminomethyl(34) synthesis GTPase MnmE [Desulfonema ishimotonii]GBC63801.1 tRNA uridine-5-carboxymethylaminomethyl(34) synt hesis GTPase MnmE [Desulfonema ishimotonii]
MDSLTIAAIATPVGMGGIGIIRISGADALPIARSVFIRAAAPDDGGERTALPPVPESHRFYHGYIRASETDRILDEVLLVLMRAPRSYTREDVVEIHAHAGPAALRAILNLVLKQGARLAGPGEFTRRAFLNGRIDLTQAEGVMDMISAQTDRSLDIATAQLRGGLGDAVAAIREPLSRILAHTEAAIDFPEDVGEEIDADDLLRALTRRVIRPLETLAERYEDGHILRDGLSVVVAGRPNVGKSSLMNVLLRQDRAIVTPIPGTTRDTLEEQLSIRGIPVMLSDTAGLHETSDPVEKIGIERACARLEAAELVLFMTDAGLPPTEQDHAICQMIRHKPVIWVINKVDLVEKPFVPNIPDEWAAWPRIGISARHGDGIDALRDLIAETVLTSSLECESVVIPNLRHRVAIEESLASLREAVSGIDAGMPFELVNIDVREAFDRLGDILGITVREDVLDHIFSNFCIGK